MKKVLSIILALTIAFSLLPTFASAETTETESAAPQAFSINFENIPTDTITPYKTTHAQYGKRWYIKIGDTFQGSNWKMLIDKTNSNAFENTKETTVQYYSTAYYVPLTITEAYSTYNTIAFEITAETSGIYTVSVIGRSSGSGVGFSASVNDIKIGEWNLHADKIGVAAGQKATCSSTIPVFLNKGANVLKIEQAIGGNGYFGFEFTPVDLTEATAEIVLPETLTIGETASVGLKLTIGEKTVVLNEIPDDIDVVLASDSSSVKTGEKTVAAYLEGNANITAEVTVNGVTFTPTKQIAVSKASEAKAFTLDFSAPISSIDLLDMSDEGNYYITSTSKMFGANWEAVTSKSVSTLIKSNQRIRYFKGSRLQCYAYEGDLKSDGEDDPLRDTMAFDFYVPADGVYDLSAVVWKSKSSGYASLYIDDVFAGKHDLYNDTTLQNVTIDDYGKASLTAGKHRLKIVCAASSATISANAFCNITFTPSPEDEALKEAFKVEETPMTDYVAPSVVSVSAGGSVITPEKNSDGSYDIEAAEENKDGAKFLYWAKGLKANKKIVSFSNKLEGYIPEEDGADWLIAVYDNMLPAKDEYYNANGQLIAIGEKPALPSMAGYGKASDWKQYRETNIYVAEYNGTQPDDVEVTVNGEKKTVPYGTEITCTATAASFKCWTKSNINGKTEIVSAENVYKFKAWEDCSVDAVNEAYIYNGDKFKIVVDSFNAGNETGIMAEFIGFGSNVVEKGIMWNDNKIAMTKPGCQFSVVADEAGTYKGYAIVGNATDGYTLITDGAVTISAAE